MIRTFVFTSYELYPINAGGCGVFLYNAIQELLKNQENKIILLLDMPYHECEHFKELHQPQIINHENLRILCLSEWIRDISMEAEFSNIFLEKSYRFYKGIKKLEREEQIDYIEFFDYVGIGYFTLKAKRYEKEFSKVKLGVRAHCTIDLMDIEQIPTSFDINKLEMYQMEKESIQDADCILVPSKAWGEIYATRYGAEPDKIVVSPPPVKEWDDVLYEVSHQQNDVLFYGRIFQLKGVDMLIDAAVSFMSMRGESDSKFYLVGYDGLNSNNIPYKTELIQRIPEEFLHRFIFTGHLNHKQLEGVLKTVKFAVFPNYVESFCYSIHELYNIGVPIICNAIPAFTDYFIHGKNSLTYNGTSTGLLQEMVRLFDDENLRLRMSKPYKLMDNNFFIESYSIEGATSKEHDSKAPEYEIKNDYLCSLIVIANNSTMNFKDLLDDPIIDRNQSYVLYEQAPGTPIHFLGKLRYARKLEGSTDNSLLISNYVLVCYSDDIINPNYITESIKILIENEELKYVGAKFSHREYSNDYSLLEPNTYWNRSRLTRAIIKMDGKNNTVRDIYDIRFKGLGEKQILRQPGYILPREYIKPGEQIDLDVLDEHFIFNIHHHSKSDEWNPYILYPFLLKQKGPQRSILDDNYNKHYFIKKIYHKLKHNVDRVKGRKGKYLLLFLDSLRKQFKKRF